MGRPNKETGRTGAEDSIKCRPMGPLGRENILGKGHVRGEKRWGGQRANWGTRIGIYLHNRQITLGEFSP